MSHISHALVKAGLAWQYRLPVFKCAVSDFQENAVIWTQQNKHGLIGQPQIHKHAMYLLMIGYKCALVLGLIHFQSIS